MLYINTDQLKSIPESTPHSVDISVTTVKLDSPTLSSTDQSNLTTGSINQSNSTTISPIQSNQTANSNNTIKHG